MEKLAFRNLLKISLFLSLLFINASCAPQSETASYKINTRPIIGILSQETSYKLEQLYPDQYQSYIAASYVKYVESAGARVIPIKIGQPVSYYEHLMKNINGVLFPGGSTFFNQSKGYADAGDIIYKIAERFNRNGDYFPIWGTCLGFELLTYLAANRTEHRIFCNSHSQPLPLEFTEDYKNSKLFGNAPEEMLEILRKENVTGNYHGFCTTQENLAKVKLQDTFRVLSLNHDRNNIRFVSTLEHTQFPFYGVQYHPEKNNFEWAKGKHIPHSPNAMKVSHYFADFFVNEARKNQHFFLDKSEEYASLIYNYSPAYTGVKGSDFEQSYLFD